MLPYSRILIVECRRKDGSKANIRVIIFFKQKSPKCGKTNGKKYDEKQDIHLISKYLLPKHS